MLGLLAAIAPSGAFHAGLILTAFGFGFRHGIDWDHIAALTDITSSQQQPRRAMLFATLYAVGHAVVVFVLGFGAIALAARLPTVIDATMQRVAGATLVVLALYVFYGLARHRQAFRMRSRWMLLFAGVRTGRRWAQSKLGRPVEIEVVHDHAHLRDEHHEHEHEHRLEPAQVARTGAPRPAAPDHAPVHRHVHRDAGLMPDDPCVDYAPYTAFGVGMIHGVGAETPTQLLIFLTAAGAGGKGVGLLLLMCFLAGLLTSNTVVAAAGTLGFLGAARNFGLYVAISLTTALFSLVVGVFFLVGGASMLPAILGG